MKDISIELLKDDACHIPSNNTLKTDKIQQSKVLLSNKCNQLRFASFEEGISRKVLLLISACNKIKIHRLIHYGFYDIPDYWLELCVFDLVGKVWSCVYTIGNS